jgi:hypothetical protein
MPTPTTKNRQELCSRFITNAIPQEGDYADLIAASLNQAEDGLLKLPNQPLALLAPKQPPEKVNDPIALLNVFADPAAADPSWQLQLTAGDKPGIGLADHRKNTRLFLDGTTGNLGVGTGTAAPAQRLTVEGPWDAGRDPANNLSKGGQLAIKGDHPQLDFIDTDANQPDWAMHVNDGKLSFIRSPWEDKNLVIDNKGNVGIGTDTPTAKLHVAGSMDVSDVIVSGFIRAPKYRTIVLGYEFESDGNIMTPCQDRDYEKKIYGYTGSDQILKIPEGIAYVFVKLWGAGGGASLAWDAPDWNHRAAGGGGGHTRALFPVTPGDELILVVGRGGTSTNGTTQSYGGGGTNGSDNSKKYSGHGGGYCGIFRKSIPQHNARLISGVYHRNALAIAGGGGGGGSSRMGTGNVGGAGGGLSGEPGQSPYHDHGYDTYSLGGGGGTQSGGGIASDYREASGGNLMHGTPGGRLQGGRGSTNDYGGGGGGGYFGGGGGSYSEPHTMAGGGGGSGFILSSFPLSGTFTGHGREPAFSWDPDIKCPLPENHTYPSGATPITTIGIGYGGEGISTLTRSSQSGGHALAVIYLLKKIT